MKNYQTPRTLAECEFTTGYRGHDAEPRGSWGYAVVTALAFALIGCLLAYRG